MFKQFTLVELLIGFAVLMMLAGFSVAISGCAVAPPTEVDFNRSGTKPTDVEKVSVGYFEPRLKDPFSAQYKVGEPTQCYMRSAPVTGGKITQYGWCWVVSIDAKNSFGGYVGYENHRLFYGNGLVTEYFPNPFFSEPWLVP
jgi:hypothetical protein